MYICQFFTSIAVAKTSQKRHEYHFCFSITFPRRGKIDTIPYQLKPSHSLSTMGKPGSQLWRKAQPTDYVSQTSSLWWGELLHWWTRLDSNQQRGGFRIVRLVSTTAFALASISSNWGTHPYCKACFTAWYPFTIRYAQSDSNRLFRLPMHLIFADQAFIRKFSFLTFYNNYIIFFAINQIFIVNYILGRGCGIRTHTHGF